jgi:hypothetical protein
VLERAVREDWGRVLASLVGWLGEIELAEDAVQEAFATAAERWPRDGTPDEPESNLDVPLPGALSVGISAVLGDCPFRPIAVRLRAE